MNPLRHQIIRASAGTGKTFALSDRIVRLLCLGAAPASIVALTFTRKAAAEFANAVLSKLAVAALDPQAAAATRSRLELPDATDFGTVLTLVIRDLERLQFGTLDSFFQRAVSANPFALGLGAPVEVLDESAAAQSRERILARMVNEETPDDDARRALMEAFREATWGVDEKRLMPRLLRFVETCRSIFVGTPSPQLWGNERSIWPQGCPWLPPPTEIAPAAETILAWSQRCEGRAAKALEKLAAAAIAWQPGMDLPDDKLSGQFFEALGGEELPDSLEVRYFGKPLDVPAEVLPALQCIVRHYLGSSVRQALRVAAGIHHLLERYDRAYLDEIHRSGRLSFSDVVELLRRTESIEWEARLDSRLQHWLFDEFQDTSLDQWSVLGGLVDEVLQDPVGDRSVFFVGDAKQAIYRWRGGEHRLLAGLEQRYAEVFELRALVRSFRSAPAIIELVNRFGTSIEAARGRLPDEAIEEWRALWAPHSSAISGIEGHATVREIDDAESLPDQLLEILREVDPIGRGLTCAILTRGNREATAIAEALRERGFLSVAAETDVAVVLDHPLTRALLALISATAHPSDTASRGIVEMSPLGTVIARLGGWDAFRPLLTGKITLGGFAESLQWALDETGATPDDRFTATRIEQFFDIARTFDAAGSGRPDDFVRFARESTRRDSASAGRVQIMTIHKAKGLGFDMVLLPVTDNTRLDASDASPLLIGRDAGRTPRWILGRPPAAVAEHDPALREARRAQRIDAAFEALCVHYVALTRARFGLHVLVAKNTKGLDEPLAPTTLIAHAVGDASLPLEIGQRDWFSLHAPSISPESPLPAPADWSSWQVPPRLHPRSPSRKARTLRRSETFESLEIGSAIHAAFASIEWLDSGDPPLDGCASGIRDEVLACLAVPDIRALFQRGASPVTLWRERAFDVILDGEWISGVFDRVIFEPSRTLVIDFKTDQCDPATLADRHAEQMRLYRDALRHLGASANLEARLVHVPTRSLVAIP